MTVRNRAKNFHFHPCKPAGCLINCIHFFAGWWRNWLAHRTVDPVVAGSNPVHPAIQFLQKAVNSQRIRGFLLFCRFSHILKQAKVDTEAPTFHSWRHTFRTRLSEAGVSDDLAKRLGGWTEDTTAARYDHAERVEELRAAVEKRGEVIRAFCPRPTPSASVTL